MFHPVLRNSLLVCLLVLASCASPLKDITPGPKAERRSKQLIKHGDQREDPYYWLRDRKSEDVLNYLKKENAYAAEHLSSIKGLREDLFEEMKGRLKKDDSSVPFQVDQYFYYTKFTEKSEFPIIARKKGSLDAKEEIILDANELAKGKKFFKLGNWEISPNHQTLAYSTDVIGRRIYDIHFKNLSSGKTLEAVVKKVTSNFQWANDNQTLFYTKQHPKTLRNEWIYSYHLSTKKTRLVYRERDEKFYTSVSKSKSGKYLFVNSNSSEASEVRYFRSSRPLSVPRIFQKRRKAHEYSVEHIGNGFLIISNYKAKNFKVMRTPDEMSTEIFHWKSVIGHRSDVLVEGVSVSKSHFAFAVRKDGVREIEIMKRSDGKRFFLPLEEKSHVVGLSYNPQYDAKFLRYYYQSMTQPSQVIDYTFSSGKKAIRKEQEVLGGFDSKDYISERIVAKTSDGTEVPISIIYHKKFKKDGKGPLLLYGYGSYGNSMEPWFSGTRLSLLERGFGFAIAHIRGGSEMGRHWYEDGKRFSKKNTFSDFVACAEHLVKNKYVHPKKLYAMGGSAGGLLMGAVMNMRPELFRGIVAQVPFVDVLTTMLDDTIPLTTNEYQEWGNPNQRDYYFYMKSYSPYDNIKAKAYPHLLVTAGLHDSQVQYWEPAKWVAKLRHLKTDQNLVLLDTDLEAGHGGKSGRFKSLEDRARDYAFILFLNEEM